MAKYVIEIPEESKSDFLLYDDYIDSNPLLRIPIIGGGNHTYLETDLKLTSYTEPDLEGIKDKAHEEAWTLAQKIDDLNVAKWEECFGEEYKGVGTMHNYSYSEAKAKYNAWKADKEQIRMGDEIISELGSIAVVMHIDSWGDWQCFNRDGYFTLSDTNKEHWRKTGRTFLEVVELLEKMREES